MAFRAFGLARSLRLRLDIATDYLESATSRSEADMMEWITFLAPYPAWIKILFAVGAICIFTAVIGMVFTTVPKSRAETPGGSVNVTSNNQRGGITANTVNTGKP
jgi:hypothetical protein